MDAHKLKLELEAKATGRGFSQTADDAKELKRVIGELRDELAKAERRFENTKNVSIALKSEYRQLRASGEGTREMFKALSAQISKAEAEELSAITATRKLIEAVKEVGDESVMTASDIKDLSDRLQESEGFITGVGGKAALQAKKMDELRASTDRAGDELGQLGGKADQANSSLDRLDQGTDKANQTLKAIEGQVGVTAYAMGNILADGIQDAAQALVDFGKESVTAFADFDEEARRTFAQIPGMSADMRESLSSDARILAAEIGRLPEEVLPALRKAMNLGISEDNVLESVRLASIAARVGNEDLVDTMVLGQSVVNAYGGELYDLSEVYDQLNYITQSSNLEFGDLNANMTKIISAAAEAGIGLDSVAGAMITMNRQGDDATEIADLLSNVLTQISIEGTALGAAFKDAAGVGFREFTAAGGTLAEGLVILSEHANATGQDLLNMVGGSSAFYRDIQAARGVLELTGRHAAALTENTQGAAEATNSLAVSAAEFEGSASLGMDKLTASFANLKLATGEWLFQLAEGINLIENTNMVARALSGELGDQVGKQASEMVAAAAATGDYAAAAQKLKDVHDGMGIFDFGMADNLSMGAKELVDELAAASSSYEDFLAKLDEAQIERHHNWGTQGVLAGFAFDLEATYFQQLYDSSAHLVDTYEDVAAAVEKVKKSGSDTGFSFDMFTEGSARASEFAANIHNVLDVLDGDTVRIELEGEIKDVRFRNINAPEIQHGEEAAMAWAHEAMDVTQRYFDNNPLNLQGEMDRESYDRIIASVPNLERELVSRGMAIPLPVSLTEDEETFAELEKIVQRAAAAGIGMFEDQALAARVLSGEMVDLGVYYAELAEHQTRLTGHFEAATGPVTTLFQAYQTLADAPAWGIDDAKAAVVAGNEAIVASYQTTAYEIYLAQNGITEGTIAMGVAMGVFTEQEGLARLEFANTQTAIEELILSQQDLKLSDEELITATQLLIEGLAKTPAEAANAAKGMDGLGSSASTARDQVRETRDALLEAQGDYSASFTITNKTINKTENHPPTGPGGSGPPYTPPATPVWTGGRLQAGSPYLVGDAPGGRLTPYSELFIPDKSGYLLDAQSTAALVGKGQTPGAAPAGSGSGGITIVNHFYMNAETASLDQLFAAQEKSIVQAAEASGVLL